MGEGGEHTDDGLVGLQGSHRARFGVLVGFDTQFTVNKTSNAGLETVFEAIFTSGVAIVNGATGEVATGEDQGVHFRVNREIIFHGALGEGHFRLVGTLNHAIIAKGDRAMVFIDDDTAVLRGGVFGATRNFVGDIHKVFVPRHLWGRSLGRR